MTVLLIALALFVASSWAVAGLVFPAWNGLVERAPGLARGSVLVAVVPLVVGATLALAALVPGDPHLGHLLSCHCDVSMPGWLHLCPVHPTTATGLIVPAAAMLALLLPGRLRALAAVAGEPFGRGGGAEPTFVDLPRPVATLSGWWAPSLVVDRALWNGLSDPDREAVLAHERAHLARRDPLVLMLLRLLAAIGPRGASDHLVRGWLDHAEHQADAAAAHALGDPLLVAGALVRCARLGSRGPALSWTGGRVERRVHRLLEAEPRVARPDFGAADLLLVGLAGLLSLATTPWLHHQLEHLLNLSL